MVFFLLLPLFICQIFTFDQLSEVKQYPIDIEIRGFLYAQEGQWILAKEPNLKSCCVNKQTHIIIKGLEDNFSPSKTYLLQGKLKFSSDYFLEGAKVVEEKKSTIGLLALFAIIGIIALGRVINFQ